MDQQQISVQGSEQVPLSHQVDQEAIRREAEEYFKPYFEQYEEDGGIPMPVLRDKLREHGATQEFPQGKIDLLLKKADTDHDGRLSYEEFLRIILSQDTPLLTSTQLSKFQLFVRGAVSSVVPSQQKTLTGEEDVVESYISQYSCKPPPLFIILISLIETAIFIYYVVDLAGTPNAITANGGVPLDSPFIYNPRRRYEAWRYLTYMFIHQGYMHLIFNLIFQLLIGIPLEMVHKWWRVGIVYSLGVIAGSMCHSVFDVNTLLAGASGGCYALIGAHLAIIVMNWKEMTHEWMEGPIRFILSAPVRLVVWILLAGIDTGLAVYQRYTDETSNVGYAAHFGGALAGVLVGIPVLKNIDAKPFETIIWWIALVTYLLLFLGMVLWNVFYPGFPETDWRPCCP